MLVARAVDCELELKLGHTKGNKLGIASFTAKHTALRNKSKDWLSETG